MTVPCYGQVEWQCDLSVFPFKSNAIVLNNDFQRFRVSTADENLHDS